MFFGIQRTLTDPFHSVDTPCGGVGLTTTNKRMRTACHHSSGKTVQIVHALEETTKTPSLHITANNAVRTCWQKHGKQNTAMPCFTVLLYWEMDDANQYRSCSKIVYSTGTRKVKVLSYDLTQQVSHLQIIWARIKRLTWFRAAFPLHAVWSTVAA